MKTLVFWGGGSAERARALAAQGASFLLWDEAGAGALREAGVEAGRPGAYVTLEESDQIDEAAIAWTKDWGRRPLVDGRSFRELFEWKGVALWWFAELYLHHSTRAPRYVRILETLSLVLDAERPDEVEAVGLPADDTVLLARICTARGLLFHGRVPPARSSGPTRLVSWRSRWNGAKAVAAWFKASLAGEPERPAAGDGRKTVLFLSHAAFWRARRDPETDEARDYEHYFDRLIPDVAEDPKLRPFVVAVGPRAAFRRRGLRDRMGEWVHLHHGSGPYVHVNRYCRGPVVREVRRGARAAREAWSRLRRSAAVREAFSHRGVAFADLAEPDLAATMLLQLPWAVRCYEEMSAVLAAVRPDVVCLYAESSGWGRAALAACRAAGIPAVAVQHGILYPKYYSYRHDADETDCPRPDRTAVFGEAARRFLVERGRYAPESLVVTGSPKFDDLLRATRRWDRDERRARLHVASSERLVVVASRFRGIRETHQAIGSAFPGLLRAASALPGVHLLVKPHPAEPAEAYEQAIRAASLERARVVAPGADLMELLHAADALVTVESLSAVEALVLGRPVLVLNMPTNLRALVDQGAALGVRAGEDPAPALHAILFDAVTRARLEEARTRYLSDVAFGVDGGATARIRDLLRRTAEGRGVVALRSA